MSLSPNGQLSGTPLNPGTFSFTLTVTDSSSPNQAAKESVTLLIKEGPLAINATPLPPGGAQALPYVGFLFTASGGSAPFTFHVSAGSLASGLALSTSGALSGTPVNPGTSTFTVIVQDSSAPPRTNSHAFTITILPTPPVVNLSPSSTVIGFGQIFTFNWTSSYASSCTGNGSPIATSGTVAVTDTNTIGLIGFTVTCTGPGGTVTATAPVVVTSTTAGVNKLVADSPGPGSSASASNLDTNLVNPWGIAFRPGPGAFVVVANDGTSTSTQYDASGVAQPPPPAGSPLVINFPTGAGGAGFRPTGVVANATADFVIGSGASASPAQLIYASESGIIAAWAPSVSATTAVATYTDTGGAVYTGLAVAKNGGADLLYAADLHGKKIDVFDGTFKKQTASAANFSFSDPSLPAGYAPFGIQAIDNGPGGAPQLYVTYAQPQGTNAIPTAGPGLGVVDIFDANGSLVRQLIVGGTLNAPWGVALAPTDFGSFGGLLLISNFGDGKINAFDPATGQPQGTLSDLDGNVIAVPGLRGLAFGNDVTTQINVTTESHDTLFFTAGPNNGANGLFGRIDLVHTTPVISSITVTPCTSAGCSPGTSTISANVTSQMVPLALVEFFVNGAYYANQSFGWGGPLYSESWPSAQPIHLITVKAFDMNGNMATRSVNF
jgi:uncharacterized protein (TIGR03118 family)